MRKFLRDQLLRDFELPQEYGNHFKELIDRLSLHKSSWSDSCGYDCRKLLDILHISDGEVDIQIELWFCLAGYSFGSPHVIGQPDDDEHQYLFEVYNFFLAYQLTKSLLFLTNTRV